MWCRHTNLQLRFCIPFVRAKIVPSEGGGYDWQKQQILFCDEDNSLPPHDWVRMELGSDHYPFATLVLLPVFSLGGSRHAVIYMDWQAGEKK
jgi:hypothetical protein